ncbi:hypothetical protein EHW99_0015 [Erwinia amylovora]|uniref:Uncharacterized protein n=3 Tax=Erwinia amylovora TaxID=552 RepID=A0A831EI95_ERWAM|nr:hypothetical protein EaACW_0016 [Erwinia amylovora ACW56400]QJQ52722.1 hypothetical protein EHX00_0015 [Erwinia amylovora]CBA18957.1 hypothetical protein predicted by Glimmer/Critica [Erwinia amylovora CFBP1430]CBX78837.1 hypothetical protein predicted by Glimmer/Critica [Erwinia amylovora ATCC BAA-2158]CCO76864.1 hypothetical protein BN432_0016 [Erwinia amylovora Ea356]CCO80640.1 hypothetical protein BN433_0018 [Erwinia amylovora Ea266]CCO84455.1 hypothetical protein BN434_0016 [Erwinia a
MQRIVIGGKQRIVNLPNALEGKVEKWQLKI